MKEQLEDMGYAEDGVSVNPVFHEATNQMAVEIMVGGMSIIVDKKVAEAIACDLMESVGFCEAHEAGDQETMQAMVDKALARGAAVGEGLEKMGLTADVAKEYDSAEDFITDMEQPAEVKGNKTLH